MSSSMRKCQNCGGMNPAEAKFCTYCGAKIEQQSSSPRTTERTVYHQEYQESPYSSSEYTRPTPSQSSSPNTSNYSGTSQRRYADYDVDKTIAGILALLLGSLGIHCFYLGDTGKGILYLCLSVTGISAILGIVEGIIYLTESDEEFYSKRVHTQYHS